MQIIRDLWLCDTCMLLAVNGEAGDETPERIAACDAGFERLGAHLSSNFTEGDGEDEFSWRQCDCCLTRLGGSRFRFAILG